MRRKKTRRKHGQTSVEFISVFSIALFMLLIFTVISQSNAIELKQTKIRGEAKNTVEDLAAAAGEVYTQGEGAKKSVLITIPPGYEYEDSFVSNKSIKLRILGNDYVETTGFDVYGSLPNSVGKHVVWVESVGSSVRVGNASIRIHQAALSILMNRNETKTATFDVENIGQEDVNVTLSFSWPHSEVGLNSDYLSFSLVKGRKKQISIIVDTDSKAVGYYSGKIDVKAETRESMEIVGLPITVEIALVQVETMPKLRVIPQRITTSVLPNDSIEESFLVCTNSETALNSVDFQSSPGKPGLWISNFESIGVMSPDSCKNKSLNFTIPINTEAGSYSGFIDVLGNGVPGANATATLLINVGQSLVDLEGPEVSNIIINPTTPYVYDSITITANASDINKGDNPIQSCQIRYDGGPWINMSAEDGLFDESTEWVTNKVVNGFDLGSHILGIRCTDSLDNVGQEYIRTFKVRKAILFISKKDWLSNDEWYWTIWMWLHDPGTGHYKSRDIRTAKSVIDGSTDIKYYSVAIMSEYQNNQGLGEILNDYVDDGGRVVFLGAANTHGPKEVGIAENTGTPYYETTVRIVNNNHPITSGLGDFLWPYYYYKLKTYGVEQFNGNTLAVSEKFDKKTVLGESGGYVIWGIRRPYFYYNWDDLSQRVIDYSIEESSLD
jgi:hypothetical protein